jgi:two-component system NtrC family sensor kinase
VLYNLIMNAVDAVFERHGESGEGALRVAAKMSGGAVEIRVTDNGPGMDEATRNRIFDMFFTTKPPGKGTGQGLTICHRIIADKHGGEIFCQSEPGQGTTFTIRLPIGTADADEAGAQAG